MEWEQYTRQEEAALEQCLATRKLFCLEGEPKEDCGENLACWPGCPWNANRSNPAIWHLNDLAKAIGVETTTADETISKIAKHIYKNTDCGAWIHFQDDRIQMGSIVEGSDAETSVHTLIYPFLIETFWDVLAAIETEADQLWKEANT